MRLTRIASLPIHPACTARTDAGFGDVAYRRARNARMESSDQHIGSGDVAGIFNWSGPGDGAGTATPPGRDVRQETRQGSRHTKQECRRRPEEQLAMSAGEAPAQATRAPDSP